MTTIILRRRIGAAWFATFGGPMEAEIAAAAGSSTIELTANAGADPCDLVSHIRRHFPGCRVLAVVD